MNIVLLKQKLSLKNPAFYAGYTQAFISKKTENNMMCH